MGSLLMDATSGYNGGRPASGYNGGRMSAMEAMYGELIKEGVLEKLSGSFFQTWQPRPARLYSSALILSDPSEWKARVRQCIPLKQIEKVSMNDAAAHFSISVQSGRTFQFRGGNFLETSVWFRVISRACGLLEPARDDSKWAAKDGACSRRPVKKGGARGHCEACAQTRICLEGRALGFSADSSSSRAEPWRRKCQIINTVGPACQDVAQIARLMDAGMDIARLSFSEGSHAEHRETLRQLREAASLQPGRHIAVLVDLKGTEILTGSFKDGLGKSAELIQGQELRLVCQHGFKGDNTSINVSYRKLCHSLKVGQIILCDDGEVTLQVRSVAPDHVTAEVMHDCTLAEGKTCRFVGARLDLPALDDQDIYDIVDFALPQGVDIIAVPMVQRALDIQTVRGLLAEDGQSILVFAKISNLAGLTDIGSIIEASDGIILSRRDLEMELPAESVLLAQKMVINKCNAAGKTVVVEGRVLESMLDQSQISHADVSDITNSVLDGVDCIQLSGETAAGAYPLEALSTLRCVCEKAESVVDYKSLYFRTQQQALLSSVPPVEAVCSLAVKTAMAADSKLLITVTPSGVPAMLLAKYHPYAPIMAITDSEATCRRLRSVRGVMPLVNPECGTEVEATIEHAIDNAKAVGMIDAGDTVVAIFFCAEGSDENEEEEDSAANRAPLNSSANAPTGKSNFMQVIAVPGSEQETGTSASSESPPSLHVGGTAHEQARLRVGEDAWAAGKAPDSLHRKCRLICSVGPGCKEISKIVRLIDAGMNVACISFAQFDTAINWATVQRVRQAALLRPAKHLALLVETRGPNIQTGSFRDGVGPHVQLVQGQELLLTTAEGFLGDSKCLGISYKDLCASVQAGCLVLCDRGRLVLQVRTVQQDHVVTEVMNDYCLEECRDCHLPGVRLELSAMQDQAVSDLINFALPHGADFAALSLVQTADDVRFVRQALGDAGRHMKLIAKIENEEGLRNLDAILDVSDGAMVCRASLSLELPRESTALAQKMILGRCTSLGKIGIVAADMLESVTQKGRPIFCTEAADVANAVLDGADCIMPSAETAVGDFAIEALSRLRVACQRAEMAVDHNWSYSRVSEVVQSAGVSISALEATCAGAVRSVIDSGSKLLLTFTTSGDSAYMLAKYRPGVPILAITGTEDACRQLQCARGVAPLWMLEAGETAQALANATHFAKTMGLVTPGDVVIAVYETRNLMKMVAIS